MSKLEQNVSSSMRQIINAVNGMRMEVTEYVMELNAGNVGRGHLRDGVVRENDRYRNLEKIENGSNESAEVTEVARSLSRESLKMGISKLKAEMEECLGMLNTRQTHSENLQKEREIELKNLQTENTNLKRENRLLNENLTLVQRWLKKQNKIHEELMGNEYEADENDSAQFEIVKPEMTGFDLLVNEAAFRPDFTWKIVGVEAWLEQNAFQMESEEFAWNEYPNIRARAKLQSRGDDISLALNVDEINSFKLAPTIFFLLRDRSGNGETKHRLTQSCAQYSGSKSSDLSLCAECLVAKSRLTDPSINMDDSVLIDIHVEPPHMLRRVHSYDGKLSWTIDNFWERKEAEKMGLVTLHESPYFYTAPRGYRVRVEAHLNSSGKDDRLRLVVKFLKGEFDEDLPETFPHRTTVTLLGRKRPERSVTKIVDGNIGEDGQYVIEVCDEKKTESLVENDALHLMVSIKSIH